jgi:crotonobetainyl-CoA:carnitine CoA-transferase CaiB-like acyl-CoA transferase
VQQNLLLLTVATVPEGAFMSKSGNTLLRGYRVLELGGYLAAPFATHILASLGAEVIKVERESGDPFRNDPKHFLAANIGKKSVLIDLGKEEGMRSFEELLRSSDAIVHNLSHRAEQSLGVDFESCRAINPKIVHCAIRAFGPGPHSQKSATNPIVESLIGVVSTGSSRAKPSRQPIPYYDQMSGAFAASCVIGMFASKDESLERRIEVNLFESGLLQVASKLTEFQLTGILPSQSTVFQTAPYDFFQTKDDQWVFIGVVSDNTWVRICEQLDVPDLARDPRFTTMGRRGEHRELVNDLVGIHTKRFDATELLALMESANIPCALVQDYERVLEDPQVTFPGKLVPVAYQGQTINVPGFPVSGDFIDTSLTAVPELGQHNEELLTAAVPTLVGTTTKESK